MEKRVRLRGPDEQDLVKLHSEVNQLLNQRFTLSTTAVGTAAIAAGWMVQAPFTEAWQITAAISATLGVLLLLYHECLLTRRTLRQIAKYLAFTNASQWELDWIALSSRETIRHPYSGPQKLMFLSLGIGTTLLGLVGMGWRSFFSLRLTADFGPSWPAILSVAAGIAYSTLLWVLDKEKRDKRNLEDEFARSFLPPKSTSTSAEAKFGIDGESH